MSETLGERLSNYRKRKGLTSKQVAEKLGIARSTYSGYESGYREPDAESLAKLATLYEVSTDYLITGKSQKDKTTAENKKDEPSKSLRTWARITSGMTEKEIEELDEDLAAYIEFREYDLLKRKTKKTD